MATFAELKTQASLRLQDESNTAVSAANVGLAINQAIKYWKKERYFFNIAKGTVITTIGSNVLNLASANILYLLQGYGVTLPYQNMVYTLNEVPPDYYDAYNNNSPGRPYYYTNRDGSYELYWIPDKAYTIKVTGVEDYADLVNDGDSNDFTINADQLILFEALARLWSIRQDFEQAKIYAEAARDESSVLKGQTQKMLASGTMRVNDDMNIYRGEYYAYI